MAVACDPIVVGVANMEHGDRQNEHEHMLEKLC